MAVGVTLPGGRGQIVGASADAVYGEQIRQRARELPAQDGWVMRSCGQSAGWGAWTAATTQLYPIDAHPTIQPTMVRVSCANVSAGSTFRCALYTPEVSGSDIVFREVHGTAATFDMSALGVKEKILTDVRLIPQNQPLFAGFWPSDNVLGTVMGSMSNMDTARYSVAATPGLASLIYKSDLAGTYVALYMPLISYYSATGARVF